MNGSMAGGTRIVEVGRDTRAIEMHAVPSEEPDAYERRIRDVLSGNICRGIGDIPIGNAVLETCNCWRPAKRG